MNTMNRTVICFAAAAFAALCGISAYAAAAEGNCIGKAKELTDDGETTAKFVRLWDEDMEDWEDGGISSTASEQIGGYWYKLTLTVGSNYVFYVDKSTVSDANDAYYVGIDDICFDEDVNSLFDNSYQPEDSDIEYRFIRAEDWEEESSSTVTACVRIAGSYPGVTCKFSHYGKSISAVLSGAGFAGCELSPIEIDTAANGSFAFKDKTGYTEECYLTATLAASNRYWFVAAPSDPKNSCTFSMEYDGNASGGNPTTDTASGRSVVWLMPEEDTTVTLCVSSADLSDCTFEWSKSYVGGIGFDDTSVEVTDTAGEVALVVRRDSDVFTNLVKWQTVAETAEAGIDYVPMNGVVRFEADGALTETIRIPLVPGADSAGGVRTFAVRLDSVAEEELGEDEYSPEPSPKVARVYIAPTGSGEPEQEMPDAQEEDAEAPLAVGTFEGVLSDGNGNFAELAMTAAADGTAAATLVAGGATYSFAGTVADGTNCILSGTWAIAGKSWKSYLAATLPDGTVEDLDDAPGGTAEATCMVYVPAGDGVEELSLAGTLYRVESRLDGATLERMEEKAGRYTVALSEALEVGSLAAHGGDYGYLTVDVSGDGTATAAGALADGTAISFTATANDVDGGLAMPFVWSDGTNSLGGTIPLAGKYDYWTSLERLYNGWTLAVDDKDSPLYGAVLVADGDAFYGDGVADAVLDRATGALTFEKDGWTFTGVLLNSTMEQDAIGAAGSATDADGNVVAAALRLNWTDPDWSEESDIEVTVTFDANGGSGDVPESETLNIGATFALPSNSLTRTGYAFSGWKNAETLVVYAEGTTIPAPADDTTFVAQWRDVALQEALDCADLVFEAEGWNVADDSSAAGGTCLKGVSQQTASSGTVTATLQGPGVISFKWKLLRRTPTWTMSIDDRLAFLVDGEEIEVLSGADTADFAAVEYEFTDSGTHEISWTYNCSKITSMKSAGAIALDSVAWESHAADYALVTFDPGEDATVEPSNLWVKIKSAIGTLPVPVCATKDFVRWTNASGRTVTESDKVPKKGLALTAVWEAKSWTVEFYGGDEATGEAPEARSAKEGGTVVLPGCGTLEVENCEFAGWTDGATVWAEGASYVVGGSNTTLTAVWADARLKKALDTDLAVTSDDESKWTVISSDDAVSGGSYLKAAAGTTGTFSGALTVNTTGAGVLRFWWRLTRRTFFLTPKTASDYIAFDVDGVQCAMIDSDSSGWVQVEVEIEESGAHELKWTATGGSTSSYAWAAQNKNSAMMAIDCVEWEPAAPVDFSGVVVTEETTMAGLGVTNAAFAADAAGSAAVSNLVAWAKANDATVADVNAMEFTAAGEPENTLAKAYLLGCAPTEAAVEEAAAEFKVTSISVDGEGNVALVPADGSTYGNGRVEARYSATPAGEYTAAKPDGGTCFIRLHLVK